MQETDYFDYVVHEDLVVIIHDIRKKHLTDTTTADVAPVLSEIRKKLAEAMNYDSLVDTTYHCLRHLIFLYTQILHVRLLLYLTS